MSQKLQKPSDFFTLSEKLLETLTLHSGITDQFHSYAELPPPPAFPLGGCAADEWNWKLAFKANIGL